jgi:DNA mismatch repair ATPase MutL
MKEKPTGTAPTKQAESSQNPSKSSDDRQTREDQKQGDSQSTSEKSKPSKTSPDTKKEASGSPPSTSDSSQKVQNSPDANRGSYDTQPLRAFQPLKVPIDAPAFLMDLCKWFIYGILALAAIFWIWSARNTLLNALRNFFLQLANFWSTLFGRTYDPADPEMDKANPTGAPLRRFADFTDPFASGLAATWPTEELVRYTFEALEAWARERGYPRQKEQTPHEFARCLASNVPSLADDAGRLADLYSQVAYAPGTLPAASTTRLSQLWQNLAMQTGGSQN